MGKHMGATGYLSRPDILNRRRVKALSTQFELGNMSDYKHDVNLKNTLSSFAIVMTSQTCQP